MAICIDPNCEEELDFFDEGVDGLCLKHYRQKLDKAIEKLKEKDYEPDM